MDVILGASILASFLAGLVALFAPCCVTVLLPTYLAAVFKEKKKILGMTLVYFAGLAAVLLPIALGAVGLVMFFKNYHSQLYLVGALLMFVFGYLAFTGLSLPTPKFLKAKGKLGSDPLSVFTLGAFSGGATACCAPVLAGAVTLAALTGVFWQALVVSLAYIFGMMFPLFLLAYFYDRYNMDFIARLGEKKINFGFMGIKKEVLATKFLAGVMFWLMGLLFVFIGKAESSYWAPEYQVKIGEKLNDWSAKLLEILGVLPDWFWGALIFALVIGLLIRIKS